MASDSDIAGGQDELNAPAHVSQARVQAAQGSGVAVKVRDAERRRSGAFAGGASYVRCFQVIRPRVRS